jgi:hypothetical protein
MTIYSLQTIKNIYNTGFDFVVPDNVESILNDIASRFGDDKINKSLIFKKKTAEEMLKGPNKVITLSTKKNKNKAVEISSEEWETIRSFQPTKFEEKVGIEVLLNQIKSYINKLTDKTFIDMKDKICQIIEQMIADNISQEDLDKVGTTIFEIASRNKFYSKLYADLYSNLLINYNFLRISFDDNFNSYKKLFDDIQYVEPDVDYDKFCSINSINEKRKSVSQFFVNLAINGLIPYASIVDITKYLLDKVLESIDENGKKNIVDEITENIAILYNDDVFSKVDIDDEDYLVDDETIPDTIEKLANYKAKDYKSLSNKAIFKFMDLSEK